MVLVAGVAGLLLIVAYIVFSQVLAAVARTALYRYANEGSRVGPFAELGPDAVLTED